MPIAIVTGASAGIGKITAATLVREGYRVFGTSRSVKTDGPGGVEMLACDVTDQASVDRLVAHVLTEAGQIDLVVNNAGLGLVGGLSDGLQETHGEQGALVRQPSLKNALLNAAGTTALEQSRQMMADLKNNVPVIEVPSGANVYVLFGSTD